MNTIEHNSLVDTKKIIKSLELGDFRTFKKLICSRRIDARRHLEDYGVTVLHLSVGGGNEQFALEATKLLLRFGADPNAIASDGMTPVHVSAAWGRADVLHMLLLHGGDPWLQDDDQRNAFNHAFEAKAWHVIEMLHEFQLVQAGHKNKISQLSASPIKIGNYIPATPEYTFCDKITANESHKPNEITLCIDRYPINQGLHKENQLTQIFKSKELECQLEYQPVIKSESNNVVDFTLEVEEPRPRISKVIGWDMPPPPSETDKTYVVESAECRLSLFEELVEAVKRRAKRLSLQVEDENVKEGSEVNFKNNLNIKKELSDLRPKDNGSMNGDLEMKVTDESGDAYKKDNFRRYLPDNISVEDYSSGTSAYLTLTTIDDDSTSISYLSCEDPLKESMNQSDSDALRERLKSYGYDPGPITDTTRNIYEKKLARIEERGPPPFRVATSPQPACLSPTSPTKEYEYHNVLMEALSNEGILQSFRHLETALYDIFKDVNGCKTYYNYLLLDGRVTDNLPSLVKQISSQEIGLRFLKAIFYIGKGKGNRLLQHLTEARDVFYGRSVADHPKLSVIIDIWKAKKGVICLQVFNNVSSDEAFTREAAMIAALGRRQLTNQKAGDFGSATANWTHIEKIRLGVYLLFLAKDIFLRDRERALGPDDF